MNQLTELELLTKISDLHKTVVTSNNQILIGIAGIPGSGKSTLSQKIMNHFHEGVCQIVPMDGYHLYLKDLSPQQIARRGAPDTFDSVKFLQDLKALKETKNGSFPSFDHALKDPVENAITIKPQTQIVLIEGLYLLLKEWGVYELLDIKIFMNCDQDEADNRVGLRHLQAKICNTMESAMLQAKNNDRVNAQFIQKNSSIDENTILIDTTTK